MSRSLLLLPGFALAFASPAFAADRGSAFNPKISLILDSQFSGYSSDTPANIGGVLLGPDTDLAPSGFSLGETEMVVESNVDDQWHGWATVSLGADNTVAVEEAYANTIALPYGLGVKLGRFKSDIGYQNHVHAHAWEFTDAPLVYRALLGGQLADDGVQVRWVAPVDLLLEIGAEGLRGDAFPAGGIDRKGFRSYDGFVHLGGDWGTGASWRLGLSQLHANANARPTGDPIATLFSGHSNLSIVDAVFKWAPDGNPTATSFVFNAEYFRRAEGGGLVYDPNGLDATNGPGPIPSAYDGTQSGYYAQAVYQFLPRWRAGIRHDWLHANNAVATAPAGTSLATVADSSYDPTRESVMVDFSNSEFSRIRVQYNADKSRPGGDRDDQYFVQFIYSIGSHPAHQF